MKMYYQFYKMASDQLQVKAIVDCYGIRSFPCKCSV